MKHTKRIFAIFMSLAMVMTMMIAMSATVFADETSQHEITITNTDQNVSHTYEGYQIFKGKLDAGQTKLSDVVWGDGVDGAVLLAKLKRDATHGSKFSDCTSAADVAKVLGTMTSTSGATESAGDIDAIATIIAESGALKAANKISFTESKKNYTATVTGDGYYFIKDVTTKLKDDTTKKSDTLSKYLLAVVKDTEIVAKDTGLNPKKEIVSGNETVKTGTAAIGDPVQFQVTITVPNTKKYVDHFVFDMVDKLPAGLTFMQIDSVKVENSNVPYTMKTPADYTKPASNAAAAEAPGGQEIKLVFNKFKANAEAGNWIGKDMVIKYTAVVNKNADFTPTGNINEVKFDYSNDPNHTYTGDEPGSGEPMGETPTDKTKTLLTNIELTKTGDNKQVEALEGAEFTITSEDYNITLVSGEKFDEDASGTYYKLKDGSYTTTAPTDSTATSYASTTKYKKTEFTDTVTTPGTSETVKVITGSDGKISLKGLKAGTYTLKETKAPSGYNLDETEYTVVLGLKGDVTIMEGTGAAKIEMNSSIPANKFTYDEDTATAKITIDNKSGTVLPGTGGIGTVIFYVLGSLLVVGCGIILISKKRMSSTK